MATIRREKERAPVLVRATWHPGTKEAWLLQDEPIDAGSLGPGTSVRFTADAARGPIAWSISADGSVQRLGKRNRRRGHRLLVIGVKRGNR